MTSTMISRHRRRSDEVCTVDPLLAAMVLMSLPLRGDRYQSRHPEQIVGTGRKVGLHLRAGMPITRLFLIPPTVLSQPKISSIRFLVR
jgi:hypothetical protein